MNETNLLIPIGLLSTPLPSRNFNGSYSALALQGEQTEQLNASLQFSHTRVDPH